MTHKFAILQHLCSESTKRTMPGLTHLREVETLRALLEWVGGEEMGRIKVNLTTMKSINWNIQDNDYLQHFKIGCKHWAFGIMRRLPKTKVITSAMYPKPSSPLFRGVRGRGGEFMEVWEELGMEMNKHEHENDREIKSNAIQKRWIHNSAFSKLILWGQVGGKDYKCLISYKLLFLECSLHGHAKRESLHVKKVIFFDGVYEAFDRVARARILFSLF